MTVEDKPEFAAIMTYLCEAFGERGTTGRTIAYFDALIDQDVAFVKLGAKRAVKTLKFFPKPTELRELTVYVRAQYRLALRERQDAMLPPRVAAQDTDLCTEIENGVVCGKTVAQHRAEFRNIVENWHYGKISL